MTLQDAKILHAFNSWANARLFDAVAPLPEEQYLRDMKSSHGGIHGTLTHIVAAQKIWIARFTGNPDAKFVAVSDVPNLAALRRLWETVGYETAKFLGTMTDARLNATFTMTTSKGQLYEHTYAQAFRHLINHSSYHRGQIVTLLRQLGVKPPGTDLILFYRETGTSSR